MSTLTFPTRPSFDGRSMPGTPARAGHCHCIGPWTEGDSCVRCGHFTQETIDYTWYLRALVIANKQRKLLVAA